MSARSAATGKSLAKGVVAVLGAAALASGLMVQASSGQTVKPKAAGIVWVKPRHVGNLDCNGVSPVQKTVIPSNACTDIRGIAGIKNANVWDGRFYDNGRYIGHDEPDVRFLSTTAGSGDNATWNETLGVDPTAAPTVTKPGKDTTHFVELTVAPWFSMALCDPYSYPQLPCQPNSDANAPGSVDGGVLPGEFPGGGSSFLEMQFYPPGMAPFADSASCDNTHWCASLHINDLECTANFAVCNPQCEEPTNFAFIQTNGVPTGPPSPQLGDVASETPNKDTLLMNQGDKLTIHIFDAPVPGHKGQFALETEIIDHTTGKTGYMQASGANGFMATDMLNCEGTPFNYEPEYKTAAPGNIVPWAADQVDVSTEFEIGHFEPCSTVSEPFGYTLPGFFDVIYNKCSGAYENTTSSEGEEVGDAACFPAGDTHFGVAPPNIVSGCFDNWFQNGDLDYDGTSYWTDWPTSTTPNTFPSTFQESPPTSGGKPYSSFQIQTDAALSYATCSFPSGKGCTIPPPLAPGKFYPYWTLTKACVWEFGNMANGNDFGKFKQYGKINPALGYPQLLGPIMKNTCS